MTYPHIKNPGFLGGSAIDLNGRMATFDFNAFVFPRDVPAKDIGSSYDFRLGEGDYTGHTNPSWVFQGYMPSGVTTNKPGSYIATFARIGSLSLLGSPCVFYDPEFSLNPAGSTWVLIKSFKVEKDVNKSGYKYNLGLMETKQW